MRLENPFHEGELLVQERLGEIDEGRRNGRVISDSILKGALKYIEQQAMAVVGSIDQQGHVWASVLIGAPGFMRAPTERLVELDLTQVVHNSKDPFWTNVASTHQLGMLIIDLGTRRRLRINGHIQNLSSESLRVGVIESYPNCPKYIQRRRMSSLETSPSKAPSPVRKGQALMAEQQSVIRSADTLFVASAHKERGVDASHRGGNPGFIRILSDTRIRIPDYVGNRMYNTLGNFYVNPRAGLIFVDFDRSRTLQLIGRTKIEWNIEDPQNETGGTHRFWDFEIESWLETDLAATLKWELLDQSPENPIQVNPTG